MVDGAKAVCRIIRKSEHKSRLLESCFSGPVKRHFQTDIRLFQGWINPDRWATIAFSVPELINIENVFRIGWDRAAFLHGKVAKSDTQSLANEVDEFTCSAIHVVRVWLSSPLQFSVTLPPTHQCGPPLRVVVGQLSGIWAYFIWSYVGAFGHILYGPT